MDSQSSAQSIATSGPLRRRRAARVIRLIGLSTAAVAAIVVGVWLLLDRLSSDGDQGAVEDVFWRQIDAGKEQDWETYYATFTPRFQASCPLARFTSAREAFDFQEWEYTNVKVQVAGDSAYVTYDGARSGTPAVTVDEASPDVYVKVDGRWLDEVDANTRCS